MPFQRRQNLHIPLASDGKRLRRRAWLTIRDRVKILRYSHKLMHRKRVTCELHDSYFRSMMIKTCHFNDGRSCIFRWPVMGRDWMGVELLYNSVHRRSRQLRSDELVIRWVGDQKSRKEDAGLRDMSLRGWTPRPLVDQTGSMGKKHGYEHRSSMSIYCSSSYRQPFQ